MRGFFNECRIFSASSFGLLSTFGFRASSSLAQRDSSSPKSFGARNDSETWRVHHQHCDHASEKHKQNKRQADKNSIANRVALLFLASVRRNVGKIGRRGAQFCRSRFDFLELGERSRPACVPFVAGFGRAKSDSIIKA